MIYASFVLMLVGLMVRLWLRPLVEWWSGRRAARPAAAAAEGV